MAVAVLSLYNLTLSTTHTDMSESAQNKR